MTLDNISIKGFKSLEDVSLGFRDINILIGANGSGKSNFVAIFNLLNQIVQGNLQTFISKTGGANAYLFMGEKETEAIELKLEFGSNSYECRLEPTSGDNFVFASETGYWRGPGHQRPYSVPMGNGHKESQLKKFADDEPVCRHILDALSGWKVYHFHDTSSSAKLKKTGRVNDNEYLRPDASNLAAFLRRMKAKAKKNYELIVDTVRMAAPFFDDFRLRPEPENEDTIRLQWRERGSDIPFLADQLSDGTLRFICLAVLLLQPERPETVIVDEPELGLHPYAIKTLAALLKSAAAAGTQVVLSTQSVTLLDQFEPKDIVVVERAGHASQLKRLDEQHIRNWLREYSLGELWNKNILGGRPTSAPER